MLHDTWDFLWRLAAGLAFGLVGGCALSSSSQARFTPTAGERSAGFTTELVRSCEIDDCRTQRVRLVMPDGEVMTGSLRLLTAGPLSPDTVAASQDRRPASLSLSGDRGSRLQCELLFSAGARNARGVCKSTDGRAYAVSF
jgi:hypothetical protein